MIKDKRANIPISTLIYTILALSGIIISIIFLYTDTLDKYEINKDNRTNQLVNQSRETLITIDLMNRDLNARLLANSSVDQSQDSQNNMIANSFVAIRKTPEILQAGFGIMHAAYRAIPFTDDFRLNHWITTLFVIISLSVIFIVLAAFFKTRF